MSKAIDWTKVGQPQSPPEPEKGESSEQEIPGAPDLGFTEEYPVDEIKVNPDFEKAMPRPLPDEYAALKEDIKKRGIQTPLLLSASDGTLIDGHTRLQIAKELGIPSVTVMLQPFKDVEDAIEQAMILNIQRRHLNAAQRSDLGLKILKMDEEKAKRRREDALVKARKVKQQKATKLPLAPPSTSGTEVARSPPQTPIAPTPTEPTSNVPPVPPQMSEKKEKPPATPPEQPPAEGETGKSLETAAKKVGVGMSQLNKWRKIDEMAGFDPNAKKAKDDALKGKISVNAAHKKVQRMAKQEEARNNPPKEPDRKEPVPNSLMLWGDSFAGLANPRRVPLDSVPLIITSTPYGQEKDEDETGPGYVEWDPDQWESHFKHFVKLSHRGLTKSGILITILGIQTRHLKNGITEHLPLDALAIPIAREQGFGLVRQVVWAFKAGKIGGKNSLNGRHESVCIFAKGPGYTFNSEDIRVPALTDDSRNPPDDLVNPGDVWYFERVTNNTKESKGFIHPCILPEGLVERLITLCSKKGDLVVDPFAGSGRVLAVASKLGRRGIGIEINPTYKSDVRIMMGDLPYSQEDVN